ncbi:MAG: SpoIIE family protein phosphatase [Spirochaetaceae bacterium JB067]
MNNQNIDQICYKILLPIGESLDLKKMLGRSLALYIGELECSMGAVLLVDRTDSSTFALSNAFSIPRNIEAQPSFKALRNRLLHHDFSDDIITHEIDEEEGIYYVMSISDIGLLVLFKSNGRIDTPLLGALRPINHKLGTACKACLQNTELKKSSKQFMDMANMLPGLIIELDTSYQVTYVNKRTQEIFKQIDSDEFRPKSIFDFFPESSKNNVLELLHNCEMGETMTSGDFWMKNSRDQTFMVNLTLSPIRNGSAFTGFRGIAIDITQRVKLEKDLQLRDHLSNAITLATQELIKSPDFSISLPKSLNLFVQEATGIDRINYFKNIYDTDGTIVKVVRQTKGEDDDDESFRESEDTFKLPSVETTLILDILKRNELFQVITSRMEKGPLRAHLEEKRIKAILVLPVFAKHRFWGFLVLSNCVTEYVWSSVECDLLKLYAISISDSIERKLAADELSTVYTGIMEDLKIAQSIQTYMLPSWLQVDDRILFSANYTPWSTIGGDLFDCVRISDTRYILYVADISGHGIQAALTMTAVKSIINMFIRSEQVPESPAEILTQINATLSKRLFNDNYMTMNYCLVDFETMTLKNFNAGHPPLFLYNLSTKKTKLLDSAGSIPIGWVEDFVYEEKDMIETHFSNDDAICLLTDGVFECFNDKGEELGQKKLLNLLTKSIDVDDCLMLPHLCYDVIDQNGYTNRNDDFSFIALQSVPSRNMCSCFYKEIYSQLAEVDQIGLDVESFITSQGGSDELGFKTRLVATEFLNNIVEHGLPKNDSEKIALEIRYGKQVTVIIRDSAVEWDPPEKEPQMDQFFDELNENSDDRGRGLQIIYAMTSFFSRRRIHKINETILTLDSDQ